MFPESGNFFSTPYMLLNLVFQALVIVPHSGRVHVAKKKFGVE